MTKQKKHIIPPRLAEKVLLWFLKDELAEEVLGDLDEKFHQTINKASLGQARKNYWYQVFNYVRPFALKSSKSKNSIITPMKIHFKYTARIFKKNSLITLASLASIILGVLSSFLIYLWVESELTTDQFHANYDKLYVPVIQQSLEDGKRPINTNLFFNTDYKEFSEVDEVIQTRYISPDRAILKHEESEFRAGGLVTDSTFFEIFDFDLLRGNENNILTNPSNMILTESFAKRIFGDVDPIGKSITLVQKGTYLVGGILKNIPSNSTISFDYIVPRHSQKMWDSSGLEFILVNNSFDLSSFNKKIEELGRKHPQFKESTLSVIPFSQNYFEQPLDNGLFSKTGDRFAIKTMIFIASIILIISALNFTNMQSTLMLSLFKSNGIKKIHGARNMDFSLEILTSRLIYALLSVSIIFGLYKLIKPSYLKFLELTTNYSWYEELGLIALGCISFIIITTLVSLFQPSRFKSIKNLLAKTSKAGSAYSAKALTTVQYVLAIVLIVASTVVFKQFKYMQNKELGFQPSNLLVAKFFDRVPYNGDFEEFKKQSEDQKKNYDYLKNELKKIPGIESFSQTELPVDNNVSGMPWKLSKSDFEYQDINLLTADPSFAKTLDVKLLKGRFFSDSLDTERAEKVIINKAAMELWGISDLEEAKLACSVWGGDNKPWQVIGVVENFNYEHLSRKIEPLIIVSFEDFEREFTFRISEERFKSTVSEIAGLYQELYPHREFTYTLLEDTLRAQYEKEKKLSDTFMLFTLVALLLSSLGLFTFALYDTQKRIKEIGIRKVIGASTGQVVSMLSSNFLKWVLLAFIIAIPIAWYAMNEWLSNFANQTQLNWWIFAAAGITATLLALATVIGQSFTAANRNPVNALRHE